MKRLTLLVGMTLLISNLATAQDRDYGDLIPEDHFEIKNTKTILKDNADISNYKISVTPKQDVYTYKVNSIRTPRDLLGKKKEFKLLVERDNGKIHQISSVSFNSSDSGGVHAVQSSSILPTGKIDSHTNCYEDYKHGLFNTKKAKEGFKCVTVSSSICNYLEKNNISSELLEEINSCSNLLKDISGHQENLLKLSQASQARDLAALKRLKAKVPTPENFFELKNKSLKNLSEIVEGYGSALSQCEYLKSKDYLPAAEIPPAPVESSSSSSQQ